MIAYLEEAGAADARLGPACQLLGLSPRTLQRWREEGQVKADGRQAAAPRREPANKLCAQKRQQILTLANQAEFAHLPPSQIGPALADRGVSIASESSFYRVLRQAHQLTRRGKAKAPTHQRPLPLQATAPNQVWSWDISVLQQCGQEVQGRPA